MERRARKNGNSAHGLGLSVLIPVYNEVENVAPLHEAVRRVLDTLDLASEILFINDGSTDGTRRLLEDIAQRDPAVRVIHFRRNFGQTAAIQAGIEHARGDVLIPLDGDLQNDPKDIPLLLSKLEEGYDVVSGWRRERHDRFFSRRLPSVAANWLISRVTGVHLHDYGCTLKAYRRDVIKDVRLYGEMHRFIPIYCSWFGGRVTEVPVTHHPRRRGTSKYGLTRVFKVVLDLITIRFMALYQTKPIHLFGGMGLLCIFLALPSSAYAFYLKIFEGLSLNRTPLLLLAAMLIILGFMFIMMGILAEMVVRIYFESQDKKPYSIEED